MKANQSTAAVFTLWLLSLAPCAAQNRGYPPTMDGARVETYKTVDDVELKIWIFEPPNSDVADKRPAIVFFFGGGWRAGTPAQFEQHCRYLAEQGMVAMAADYRVRSRHGTPALKCVEDGKSAVRWIRQNAERLGIDPDRIVAGGGSAGGHVAACTAVVPGLDAPGEDVEVSSIPNALALFNPAVLLAPLEGVDLDETRLARLVSRMGIEPKRISPIHHVRAGLPPTIIFHGEADTTVPYVTVVRYTKLAKERGNRCELVGYPGAGHGFFNYGRGGNPGKYYELTVERLHQFLKSIGYLEE